MIPQRENPFETLGKPTETSSNNFLILPTARFEDTTHEAHEEHADDHITSNLVKPFIHPVQGANHPGPPTNYGRR